MTREELLNIIETDHVQCGEAAALARMALAFYEWHDKTAWVQTDKRFDVLTPWGKHRADVLKEYIEYLENRIAQPSPVVPDIKTLARELVDNLVDVGSLDTIVKEKYLELAENICRAAVLATVLQETDHVRK